MSWLLLFIAGLLEAGWLIGLQKSESFTQLPYLLLAVISMSLSLVLFSLAIKDIPIAHAYLIWLATGASSITIINHWFYNQPISAAHAVYFVLIFTGVAGLKFLK